MCVESRAEGKEEREKARSQVTDSSRVGPKKIVTTNKCNWLNFWKCCCTKTSINYLGQQQKADTVLSTFHNYLYALPHAQKLCVHKVSQMCCVLYVKCIRDTCISSYFITKPMLFERPSQGFFSFFFLLFSPLVEKCSNSGDEGKNVFLIEILSENRVECMFWMESSQRFLRAREC